MHLPRTRTHAHRKTERERRWKVGLKVGVSLRWLEDQLPDGGEQNDEGLDTKGREGKRKDCNFIFQAKRGLRARVRVHVYMRACARESLCVCMCVSKKQRVGGKEEEHHFCERARRAWVLFSSVSFVCVQFTTLSRAISYGCVCMFRLFFLLVSSAQISFLSKSLRRGCVCVCVSAHGIRVCECVSVSRARLTAPSSAIAFSFSELIARLRIVTAACSCRRPLRDLKRSTTCKRIVPLLHGR